MTRVLLDQVVLTDYGLFDIAWHPEGGYDGNNARFFAAQSNGLVGAADPHGVYLGLAGTMTHSHVRVELRDAAPEDLGDWEDVVEVSFTLPADGEPGWGTWGGMDGGELDLAPGAYRLRFACRDRDRAADGDTTVEARYLITLWPAPPAPDAVLRTTSADAAYWHRVWSDEYVDEAPPPVVDEPWRMPVVQLEPGHPPVELPPFASPADPDEDDVVIAGVLHEDGGEAVGASEIEGEGLVSIEIHPVAPPYRGEPLQAPVSEDPWADRTVSPLHLVEVDRPDDPYRGLLAAMSAWVADDPAPLAALGHTRHLVTDRAGDLRADAFVTTAPDGVQYVVVAIHRRVDGAWDALDVGQATSGRGFDDPATRPAEGREAVNWLDGGTFESEVSVWRVRAGLDEVELRGRRLAVPDHGTVVVVASRFDDVVGGFGRPPFE